MRRIWAVALVLAVAVTGSRADDEKKDEKKSPGEQFKALRLDFAKSQTAAIREFNAKENPKEEELFAKMAELINAEMPKFMEFAAANRGSDAGFNALLFVFQNSPAETPNADFNRRVGKVADESLAALLSQYEPKIVARPSFLESAGGRGEKALRNLRTKLKSGEEYVRVTASLANLLKMPNERADTDEMAAKARASAKDAETFYGEVVAQGAEIDGLKDLVSKAKANLEELRTLGIGKTVPEIEGKDLDGAAVKLRDYRGKVVVLDVWTTWCPPCVAMIPHERKLVERMSGKPFALISVSCDEKKEELTAFLEKEKMPWVHWWDGEGGPVAKALNLHSFPTIYVLDGKGVIRYRGARGEQLDAAVDKLMKETAASE